MLFLDAFSNYRKYGPRLTSHDAIKCFAVVIMVIDHFGDFFFPDQLWWRAVGRMGFPIWFFLAGYAKPSKLSREIIILGILMIVADFLMVEPLLPANALISVCLCRVFIRCIEKYKADAPTFLILLVGLIITFPVTLNLFEYGPQALLFALCGYYYKYHREKPVALWSMVVSFLVFISLQQIFFMFDKYQLVFVILTTAFVCARLHRFTLEYYEVPPTLQTIAKPIMFIGRNTLYIYFLHFIAFEFIAYLMHPPTYFYVRWLL